MDHIHSLGLRVLPHRLHRLVQRLLAEGEAAYEALELPFKPRWLSTYCYLDEHGEVGITELGRILAVSHPTVIQIARGMREAGLVRERTDPSDGRRRLLRLTPRGKRLRPELERLWSELDRATARAFSAVGCDPLQTLDALEKRLDERPLSEEVLRRLGATPPS